MSKSGRIVLAVALFAAMAACAKKEEVVVSEPVTTEPTYTGKYK